MEQLLDFFNCSSELEFIIRFSVAFGMVLGYWIGGMSEIFFNFFSNRKLKKRVETIERLLFDGCSAVVIDKAEVMKERNKDIKPE